MPCVCQFNIFRLIVQHISFGSLYLSDLILTEIKRLGFGIAVFVCRDLRNNISCISSCCSVERNNILYSDHLKYCAAEISVCKHGSVSCWIHDHFTVFICVCGGSRCHACENIACFPNADFSFLSGVFFADFNNRQGIFFLCVISRNCERHGRTVQNITHRSLNLNKRIFAVGKNLGSDKITLGICVEHINGSRSWIAVRHSHLFSVFIVYLKSCTLVRNGFSRFRIHLYDLDIAFKLRIVDEVSVGLSVLADVHIKISHKLSTFPALGLMNRVNSTGHILGLCKAVFIARQVITFYFSSIFITACALKINLKFSSHFRSFYLSRAVIGMLDYCDISLDNVLGHCHRNGVMLNGIILSFCTNRVHSFIKQISLAW